MKDTDVIDFNHLTYSQFKDILNNSNFLKPVNDNFNKLDKNLSDSNKFFNDSFVGFDKQFGSINDNLVSINKSLDKLNKKPLKIEGNVFDTSNSELITYIKQTNEEIQFVSNQIHFFTVVSLTIFICILLYSVIKKFTYTY